MELACLNLLIYLLFTASTGSFQPKSDFVVCPWLCHWSWYCCGYFYCIFNPLRVVEV